MARGEAVGWSLVTLVGSNGKDVFVVELLEPPRFGRKSEQNISH